MRNRVTMVIFRVLALFLTVQMKRALFVSMLHYRLQEEHVLRSDTFYRVNELMLKIANPEAFVLSREMQKLIWDENAIRTIFQEAWHGVPGADVCLTVDQYRSFGEKILEITPKCIRYTGQDYNMLGDIISLFSCEEEPVMT